MSNYLSNPVNAAVANDYYSSLSQWGQPTPAVNTPVVPIVVPNTTTVPVDAGLWSGFSNALSGVGGTVKNVLGMGSDEDFAKLWGGKVGDNTYNGILSTGLQLGTGLWNAWNGMQQLDLARDQFAFQKDAFNKQYENQRTLTNARLRDRQNARLGANPNGYQSTADYMKQNGV
jgi:hypothetical protein